MYTHMHIRVYDIELFNNKVDHSINIDIKNGSAFKLRVVCGNLLIPVMLDGLVAMSSVQGWIYYECGDHTVANYTWSHRWFNISR